MPRTLTEPVSRGRSEVFRAASRRRAAAVPFPRVTIGLPVHNGERHLKYALDSLLAQQYPNFELIISDNGSTDRTPALCGQYAKADSRVTLHRRDTNAGAAWNFNHLFDLAAGKYFMWAAHDDQWEPLFVANCVSALEIDPEAVLCGTDIKFVDDGGKGITYPRPFNRLAASSPDVRARVRVLTEQLDWFAIYGLIRSDALRKTRLFTANYGSDVILLLELLLQGPKLHVAQPLFRYRYIQKTVAKHTEEISGAKHTGQLRGYTELARQLLKVLADCDYPSAVKEAMREDLLMNVSENNRPWRQSIVAENPRLKTVDRIFRGAEIRQLLVSAE